MVPLRDTVDLTVPWWLLALQGHFMTACTLAFLSPSRKSIPWDLPLLHVACARKHMNVAYLLLCMGRFHLHDKGSSMLSPQRSGFWAGELTAPEVCSLFHRGDCSDLTSVLEGCRIVSCHPEDVPTPCNAADPPDWLQQLVHLDEGSENSSPAAALQRHELSTTVHNACLKGHLTTLLWCLWITVKCNLHHEESCEERGFWSSFFALDARQSTLSTFNPLHLAASRGHTAVCALLLASGACRAHDLTQPDETLMQCTSALSLALQNRKRQCAGLLLGCLGGAGLEKLLPCDQLLLPLLEKEEDTLPEPEFHSPSSTDTITAMASVIKMAVKMTTSPPLRHR